MTNFAFDNVQVTGYVGETVPISCSNTSGQQYGGLSATMTVRDPSGRVNSQAMPLIGYSPEQFGSSVYLATPGEYEIKVMIMDLDESGTSMVILDTVSKFLWAYSH